MQHDLYFFLTSDKKSSVSLSGFQFQDAIKLRLSNRKQNTSLKYKSFKSTQTDLEPKLRIALSI